ncbi:hypothetical protein KY347_06350 [Candidatus Woesearchaeota archaeon]|nr:hypothetical protein [Candidatus Woesearchaeota archaeon]
MRRVLRKIARRAKLGPVKAGVTLGLRRGHAHVSVKPPIVKRIRFRRRLY